MSDEGDGQRPPLNSPSASPRTWLAVGDSFTFGTGDDSGGWVRRTFERVAGPLSLGTLENRAVEGAVIGEVRTLQTRADDRGAIVSAVAGANDIMRPHFDLDVVLGQVDHLLEWGHGAADLFVTTTCPNFEVPRQRTMVRLRRRVDAVNERVRAWAGDRDDVVVIDAFTLLDSPELWSADLIHPSPAGHRRLADAAVASLAQARTGT